MRILFIIISAFIISDTAHSQSRNEITRMQWLVGSWQGTYKSQPFYEAWRMHNDSMLINFSIDVSATDTIVKESGVIKYFDVTSGGREIKFKTADGEWPLVSLTDSTIIFGNEKLKYANLIRWSHSNNDHWLTGIKNPGLDLNYDMKRIPWLDTFIDQYVASISK